MDDIYALSDTQLSKRIGEKLKAIRLRRNITQQSLAEASSISLSSVKKVEIGEIGSFDTLLRILRTLGLLECASANNIKNASEIIDQICEAASGWPVLDKDCGVPQSMIDSILPHLLLDL